MPPNPEPARSLASLFQSLFLGFQATVAKIINLSAAPPVDIPPVVRTRSVTPSIPVQDDAVIDKLMSRSQTELTIKEDAIWTECIQGLSQLVAESDRPSSFLNTSASGDTDASVDGLRESGSDHSGILSDASASLDGLLERSFVLASSYERSSSTPKRETFQQSMDILRAMGICTLEVSGKYEAEALASTMVLAGIGDYVISEDTVSGPFLCLQRHTDP